MRRGFISLLWLCACGILPLSLEQPSVIGNDPSSGRIIVPGPALQFSTGPSPALRPFFLDFSVVTTGGTGVGFFWTLKDGTNVFYFYPIATESGLLYIWQATLNTDLTTDHFQPTGGWFFNPAFRGMLGLRSIV